MLLLFRCIDDDRPFNLGARRAPCPCLRVHVSTSIMIILDFSSTCSLPRMMGGNSMRGMGPDPPCRGVVESDQKARCMGVRRFADETFAQYPMADRTLSKGLFDG